MKFKYSVGSRFSSIILRSVYQQDDKYEPPKACEVYNIL